MAPQGFCTATLCTRGGGVPATCVGPWVVQRVDRSSILNARGWMSQRQSSRNEHNKPLSYMCVMPDDYMWQSGVHPAANVTTALQFVPACRAFVFFISRKHDTRLVCVWEQTDWS